MRFAHKDSAICRINFKDHSGYWQKRKEHLSYSSKSITGTFTQVWAGLRKLTKKWCYKHEILTTPGPEMERRGKSEPWMPLGAGGESKLP